jgi:hypothetical protein
MTDIDKEVTIVDDTTNSLTSFVEETLPTLAAHPN